MQGFGGYNLYNGNLTKKTNNTARSTTGIWIWRVLEIAGVDEWSDLVGRPIRVKSNHSSIEAIGHILKDEWFNPKEEFKS